MKSFQRICCYLAISIPILLSFSIAVEGDLRPTGGRHELQKSLQQLDLSKGAISDYTLTEKQLSSIVARNPTDRDALFHLALVRLVLKSYKNSKDNFCRVVNLGGTYAMHYIYCMQFERHVHATDEELFIAICYINQIELPMVKESFEFSCQMDNAKIPKGNKIKASRALCANTLENAGIIESPIIWVMNPDGFHNEGIIQTKLLIVGQQEVKL